MGNLEMSLREKNGVLHPGESPSEKGRPKPVHWGRGECNFTGNGNGLSSVGKRGKGREGAKEPYVTSGKM